MFSMRRFITYIIIDLSSNVDFQEITHHFTLWVTKLHQDPYAIECMHISFILYTKQCVLVKTYPTELTQLDASILIRVLRTNDGLNDIWQTNDNITPFIREMCSWEQIKTTSTVKGDHGPFLIWIKGNSLMVEPLSHKEQWGGHFYLTNGDFRLSEWEDSVMLNYIITDPIDNNQIEDKKGLPNFPFPPDTSIVL